MRFFEVVLLTTKSKILYNIIVQTTHNSKHKQYPMARRILRVERRNHNRGEFFIRMGETSHPNPTANFAGVNGSFLKRTLGFTEFFFA